MELLIIYWLRYHINLIPQFSHNMSNSPQDSLSYGVTIIKPMLSSLNYLFYFTESKPAAAAKSKAAPKAKPASKASPPDKKSRKKAVFSDSDDDDVVQFSPEKLTGKKVGALGVFTQMYVQELCLLYT